MRKKIVRNVILAAFIGSICMPLWAQIPVPSEEPANVMTPAVSPEEHAAAAALNKEHAVHHKAMAEQYKSLASDYGKAKQETLQKHHEELAKHHGELAKEHAKTAETHESMAKPKK